MRTAAEQKVDVTLRLSARFEPELLVVVFMAADHIHHIAWPDWVERGRESVVADTYRILDDAVGRLVESAGDGEILGGLRPRRRLAERCREPERLARLAGVPRLRADWGERPAQAPSIVSSSSGAHVPQRLRKAVKQHAPTLRERN